MGALDGGVPNVACQCFVSLVMFTMLLPVYHFSVPY